MSEKNEDIDLRGLACPEPIIRAKKLLDEKSSKVISLLVDSDVTVNNLDRLTRANNAQIIESQEMGNHYRVLIAPLSQEYSKDTHVISSESKDKTQVGTVVFISKDTFGSGNSSDDKDFSNHLLNVFLQSVLQTGHSIDCILMANSGVKLFGADSPFIKVLSDFEASGTKVFACGLCVEYYGLKDVVPREKITNMFAICEYLMTANRVLTP